MNSAVLKENKDFRRLYYRGKSFADGNLVTYAAKNGRGCCRIGITTSKKIGGAVQRNRARRVIRAAYRELESQISGSYDFVFVARSRTTGVKMQTVRKSMLAQLKKAGAIQ